jgi:hypothetical protein
MDRIGVITTIVDGVILVLIGLGIIYVAKRKK